MNLSMAPIWNLLASYFLVILPSGLLFAFLERKMGASLQIRTGPQLGGFGGAFQSLVDVFKLLQKQRPKVGAKRDFLFLVFVMVLFSSTPALPLSSVYLMIDSDMVVFFLLCVLMFSSIILALLAQEQKTHPGRLGGFRGVAQAASGLFPAIVAILCAGIDSNGLSWSALTRAQGAFPFEWRVFSNPFEASAFFSYMLSGWIMLGLQPFDSAYSFSGLRGGISSSFFGYDLVLFRFCRFYCAFLWAIAGVVIFCGSWNMPETILRVTGASESALVLQLVETTCVVSKALLLLMTLSWFCKVNPRLRVDQGTHLVWKFLGPLSLFTLIGAVLWKMGKVYL